MAQPKQTHKYFEDQFDDETVLYVFHKHPVVMRVGLILGMLGPLVGVLPALVMTYTNPDQVSLNIFFGGLAGGCVLGLLIFSPSWISWHFSVFIITDQRFLQITQKGLFHRALADIGLSQIQSVSSEVAGLQETLLGFGTIKMQTYVGDLVIHDVHHPAKIQKKISGILRDAGITTNPYSTTPAQTLQLDEETEA